MPESLHLISTEKMLCSRSKATWITLVIIMCRFALCESNYLSHPQNLLGDILHLFPYWSNSSHIEHVINEVSICFKNSEESQRLLERTPFRVADLAIAEPWVKVSNVFDSIDIQQVFQLSKCVKDLFPHNFEENRVFHEGTPHEYDGGHDVTYIGTWSGIFHFNICRSSRLIDYVIYRWIRPRGCPGHHRSNQAGIVCRNFRTTVVSRVAYIGHTGYRYLGL